MIADKLETEVKERPQVSAYVIVAKAGLWLSSLVLVAVVLAALGQLIKGGINPAAVQLAGVLVQACQVIAIVAVSVLGWHGYTGEHLFHTLRHWNEMNSPEPKA